VPILDEEDGDVTRVRPLARAALGSSDIAAGDIKDGNAEQDAPAERHRWGGSKWSIKGLSPRSSRLLSSFAAPFLSRRFDGAPASRHLREWFRGDEGHCHAHEPTPLGA
tara:strand:+ start:1911 stop:2237 length:327 start_codon:yes stop_codon:yes gene_type:complete